MHLGRLTIIKEEKPKGRAHSKFSASGAERWFNCSASVSHCEGLPDIDSPWSIEGSKAHDVLEAITTAALNQKASMVTGVSFLLKDVDVAMIAHGKAATNFILGLRKPGSEVMVEDRVYLDFIDPEMFGTLDSAVIEHFGTLDVIDYKYGAGHAVSAEENLQMIFYAIAVAAKYNWNFKRVRLWIYQPRIKGFDGPTFWDISTRQLKAYVPKFEAAVKRVYEAPEFKAGSWCHFCKGKKTCPALTNKKLDTAKDIFKANPLKGVNYGQEESYAKVEIQTKSHKEKIKWSEEEIEKVREKKKQKESAREAREVDRWHLKRRRRSNSRP